MTLAARTLALLELVDHERHAQCDALVGEARAQAAALVAQARAASRQRAHEALQEELARVEAAIAAAQAELQTQRRLHAQRRIEALLALGWQRLPEVLRARWQDPARRAAWIERAIIAGRSVLPAGEWHVFHGDGWPEAERTALSQRLLEERGADPTFVADARIEAGLRVAAGGNVVDVTLAGLLADRDEIGGRLIGLLEADR